MESGPVLKRSATWSYVIELPRDPATGKRRQQWNGGFSTKKAAEVALRAAAMAADEGPHVGRSTITVATHLDACLENQRPNLRATTHSGYSRAVALITSCVAAGRRGRTRRTWCSPTNSADS